MSYQTYITEALICGSRASHTSDRSYLLFARDAGMFYATAKSVREERSKQRFALQEFSHVRATLVHGKSGWRIAGVEPIQNLYACCVTRESRASVRNTIMLLRRVMHGETAHEGIFDDVIRFFTLHVARNPSDLENILSLRILYTLGYVAPDPSYAHLLSDLDPNMVSLTETERALCVETVAKALRESHL